MTAPKGWAALTEAMSDTPRGAAKTRRPKGIFAIPDISENEFLATVRKESRAAGWETYHTHFSKFSEAGWPDLVLGSAAQRRTLFIELKKRTGRVTEAQQKWLDHLILCGLEAAVWRPADLPQIMKILRGQRIGGAP